LPMRAFATAILTVSVTSHGYYQVCPCPHVVRLIGVPEAARYRKNIKLTGI